MSREAFQRDVVSSSGLVVVAFVGDAAAEESDLQRAATAVQSRLRGQARWLSVTADDWVRDDWNVRQTPVLVAFESGREVDRLIGPLREQMLALWTDELASQREERKVAAVDVPELTLTDANFDQQLAASPTPVLVDFWAPWCGPCKMIAPHLRLMAGEFEGRLQIGKVNIDENRGTARRFVNGGIPLLVLMHRGQEIDRVVGAAPPNALRDWLQDHLERLAAGTPQPAAQP